MKKRAGHGGARAGMGRKPKYGSKTVVMRVPVGRADDVERFLAGGDRQLDAVVEVLGSALDLEIMLLHKYAKFISIYKQSNHNIMHPNCFGKAKGFASQSFNTSA